MLTNDGTTPVTKNFSLSCPWLKRMGFYGFMFFLVKGLLWLSVPALLAWFGVGG